MFPIFMFACSLAFMFPWTLAFAFALFVFAVVVLALAGVAAVFALAAVFELLAVMQPAQKAVAVSKRTKAKVRRMEVPPVCKRYNGISRSQGNGWRQWSPEFLVTRCERLYQRFSHRFTRNRLFSAGPDDAGQSSPYDDDAAWPGSAARLDLQPFHLATACLLSLRSPLSGSSAHVISPHFS